MQLMSSFFLGDLKLKLRKQVDITVSHQVTNKVPEQNTAKLATGHQTAGHQNKTSSPSK